MTTRAEILIAIAALGLVACAEASAAQPAPTYREDAAKAPPNGPPTLALPMDQPAPPAESEAQSDAGPPGSPPMTKLADETTPKPSLADWEHAEPFEVARITDKACVVKRIHEWAGVFCTHSNYKHIELVSGEPRGHLDVSPAASFDAPSHAAAQHIVFPMHPGDRRVFEIDRWAKYSSQPDVLVSEQWLAGDAGPIIVVHGYI